MSRPLGENIESIRALLGRLTAIQLHFWYFTWNTSLELQWSGTHSNLHNDLAVSFRLTWLMVFVRPHRFGVFRAPSYCLYTQVEAPRGCTTKWEKIEGLAISGWDGNLFRRYVSLSSVHHKYLHRMFHKGFWKWNSMLLIWVRLAIGVNASPGIGAQGSPGLVARSGSVTLFSVHLIDGWIDYGEVTLCTLDLHTSPTILQYTPLKTTMTISSATGGVITPRLLMGLLPARQWIAISS